MKIIFMGTPDFAVPALAALIGSDHQIVAVFTQQPKPQNRGLKITHSPIHKLAAAHNITVYTPSTLKTIQVQNCITDIDADIIIVAAYGFIIPQMILKSKKYGCLNIHPSLLPRFRGASPLQRTIMAGDKVTGVCIIQMDEGLDTGDILLQERFAIPSTITFLELHNHCANLGARLLLQTLATIDSLCAIKQESDGVVYAHKLIKEEGKINWQVDAQIIDAQIRGVNPWPGAYFVWYKRELIEADQVSQTQLNIKVLTAEPVLLAHTFTAGTIIDDELTIACNNNLLKLLKIQMPGGKPLTNLEVVQGYPQFRKGNILPTIYI